MIDDLVSLRLTDLTTGFAEGRLCPVAVMEATLAQAEAVGGLINALYDHRPEAALAEARAARDRYRAGTPAGSLDGVPVTLKDSIPATGMRWHHGSASHGAGVGALADAPPTAALKRAGAIILAKTVMPDFGLSASGVSSRHGIVRNPWALDLSPGGSSAGAGASLAAGIGFASIGTDIAGSVRLPASQCGLAALKPTQGMIPHVPASTVRSAGPMARAAADLEILLRVLGGVHRDDRYSVPLPREPGLPDRPLRIALHPSFGSGPEVTAEVADVLARAGAALGALGHSVIPRDTLPDMDIYQPIDDLLKLRGWREYAATDPACRDRVPAELVAWFSPARRWSATRLARIEADLERSIAWTNGLFAEADVLLTPVLPMAGFSATALGPVPDMPLRHATFVAPFNQSGHPAAVIAAGQTPGGLPVGVQLVGPRFSDIGLLRLAVALETQMQSAGPAAKRWPLTPQATVQGMGARG